MKLRMFTIFLLPAISVATAHAQSNCCQINNGSLQITSGGTMSVPADGNGPGGIYVSSETDTYTITCLNSETSQSCQSGVPNNVVTAKGAGANHNGSFVACDPTFRTSNSVAADGRKLFTDQATGYESVNQGTCVQQNPQPFAISSCPVVACTKTAFCGPSGCGCFWPCTTPIMIAFDEPFSLTDAAKGVDFDMAGNGHPIHIAWTAPGAANGFLALPGADGLVHNGAQLFGNVTPQPASSDPNGFRALAVYDDPKNGGNGDGVIDARDAVWSRLRVWIDANHDGISQPEELATLDSLGIRSISLDYKLSHRTDPNGNVFRYRGTITTNGNASRVIYDVILLNEITAAQASCIAPNTGLKAVKAGGGGY